MASYRCFLSLVIAVLCFMAANSLNQLFKLSSSKRSQLKSQILDISRRTARGLKESSTDRENLIKLFEELEKISPNKASLSSPYVNAKWQLEYTTSDSILGRKGYKKIGDIYQIVDAKNLKAENSETIDFFGIPIARKVTADLTPLTSSKVKVQFRKFSVGPISFNAPPTAIGELDITYVDEDLRLSRGDKGSLFVLSKYSDL